MGKSHVVSGVLRRAAPYLKRGAATVLARGRSRTRTAGSRARTRSRSRSRRRGGNVKVEGTGGQISRTKRTGRVKRFTKNLYKRLAPQYIYTNSQALTSGGAGAQAVSSFAVLDNFPATTTDNDINKIMNQATTYQQQVVIGGTTYPVSGLAPNTQKVFLEQCTVKLMLTNQEDTNVELTIYEAIAKQDASIGMLAAWENGLSDEADGVATGGFRRGVVGISPFSSQQYCQFWRTIKKTRIVLGQGQSHSHMINYKPRRVFSAEELQNSDGNFRNLTYGVMVVQAGMPLHDATNLCATTAPTSIAMCWTKQIKFKTLNQNQTVYTLLNNVFTTTGVDEEMDVARGVAAVAANA